MAKLYGGDKRSLTTEVYIALRRRIAKGQYQPGHQLPSERRLAEEFGVSRPTIREALLPLEEEGLVIRRVGLGTFIAETPVIEAGLETLMSFTELVARGQHQAGTSYLHISESKMAKAEIEKFGLSAGDLKVIIERVRTLDDRPALYSVHTVPLSLVGRVAEERYQGSLFALLEEQSGLRISYCNTHIYATLAGEAIGEKLELSSASPLLVLDEEVFGTDGRLMVTGISYFRSNLYRYHFVRRRADMDVVLPGGMTTETTTT